MEQGKESRIYELAYMADPDIENEKAMQKSLNLRQIIERQKGIISEEGRPELKSSAYPIKDKTKGFYGWIRFLTKPETLAEIKKSLDDDKEILRFFIIKVKRSSGHDAVSKLKRRTSPVSIAPVLEKPNKKEKEEGSIKADEGEIDKRLEEILGE